LCAGPGRSVAGMAEQGALQRYLEAGTTFTQVTRARAGELVHELIKTGELEHHKAKDRLEDLVRANRERSMALISTVRGEVRKQLGGLGLDKEVNLGGKGPVKGPAARKPPAKKTGGVKVPAPDS
jgi:polyhydroxyalkanoate synthesis regulator phasin